ncbi:MAG: hypothetical protein HUJ72_04130, partial [Blautia sp.]|nr:hypothetical protein [Blautia sp.]
GQDIDFSGVEALMNREAYQEDLEELGSMISLDKVLENLVQAGVPEELIQSVMGQSN